jgi:pimeloyl-ACP methyl ester carboxylesterase
MNLVEQRVPRSPSPAHPACSSECPYSTLCLRHDVRQHRGGASREFRNTQRQRTFAPSLARSPMPQTPSCRADQRAPWRRIAPPPRSLSLISPIVNRVGGAGIALLVCCLLGSDLSLAESCRACRFPSSASVRLYWRQVVQLLPRNVAPGHRLARLALALVAVGLMAAASGAPAVAQASTGVTCQIYSQRGIVPAAIDPSGQPLPYTIVGELCASPAELHNGTTVQLLLHGATYNHSYWDFGTIDGVRYSYARDLATAGFPTFAFDQIGTGQSSHPVSSDVNTAVAAYVEHEVVQGLRNGSVTAIKFGKVIEVGHSLGSLTTWQEAITYQDVNGLIITGAVHHLSQLGQTGLSQDVSLASQDPKFAGVSWSVNDPGYLTTLPGTRGSLFYNSADADRRVIAADDNETPFSQETFANEPGKDALSQGQLDSLSLVSSTATQAIHVPVLVIMGSKDAVFCGLDPQGVNFDCSSGTAIAQQEAPYYSPQAQLEACAVPNAGHDISLHLNFIIQELAAAAWSYHFVGQDGTVGSGRLPQACGWTG